MSSLAFFGEAAHHVRGHPAPNPVVFTEKLRGFQNHAVRDLVASILLVENLGHSQAAFRSHRLGSGGNISSPFSDEILIVELSSRRSSGLQHQTTCPQSWKTFIMELGFLLAENDRNFHEADWLEEGNSSMTEQSNRPVTNASITSMGRTTEERKTKVRNHLAGPPVRARIPGHILCHKAYRPVKFIGH